MIALVVGGADCVWEDLAAFDALGVPADVVIAVNDIGIDLPRVDHWVSLHVDRLPAWGARRGPKTWETWTHSDPYGLADHCVPHPGGSSGGFGAHIALEHLGADFVVLAGCPMLSRHTHYFNAGQPFDEAGRFRDEWVNNGLVERWRGRVKSMSGWTREQMGAPTTEWLLGKKEAA